MSFSEIFKTAVRALLANKMRTLLTMLGIIIGVASVITMLSIGEGVKKSVVDKITGMGANLLTVYSRRFMSGGNFSDRPTQYFTKEEVNAIQNECPSILYVSPAVRRTLPLIYKNQNWSAPVVGASANYMLMRSATISDGEFFSEQDLKANAKVCVLGYDVAQNLFYGSEPIGETLRISNMPFKVIGVLDEKGNEMEDNKVVIPYTTALTKISRLDHISFIECSVASPDKEEDAKREIMELLRQKRGISDDVKDEAVGFEIRTQTEILQMAEGTINVFTAFLAAIACVSLLVGGVGIMNIMLVSVTERIREIGIRMALGARSSDLLMQFLFEAVTLSLFGGLCGILLGVVISKIVSHFSHWDTIITMQAIAISFTAAFIVGVFFGFYPAWSASKLDPIEALRHE